MVEILSVSNSSLGLWTPRRDHLYSRSFSTRQWKISSVASSEKNRDQERLVIAPCNGSSPSFIFTTATNLSTARRKHVPHWTNRDVRNFEADEPSTKLVQLRRTRRPMTSIVCGLSSCRFIPRSVRIV